MVWMFVFTLCTLLVAISINIRLNRLEIRYLELKQMKTDPHSVQNERLVTILEHVRSVEKTLHAVSDRLSVIKNSAPRKPKA